MKDLIAEIIVRNLKMRFANHQTMIEESAVDLLSNDIDSIAEYHNDLSAICHRHLSEIAHPIFVSKISEFLNKIEAELITLTDNNQFMGVFFNEN